MAEEPIGPVGVAGGGLIAKGEVLEFASLGFVSAVFPPVAQGNTLGEAMGPADGQQTGGEVEAEAHTDEKFHRSHDDFPQQRQRVGGGGGVWRGCGLVQDGRGRVLGFAHARPSSNVRVSMPFTFVLVFSSGVMAGKFIKRAMVLAT